jgi:hypothetical protein
MERPELKQALGQLLGPAGPEVGCDVCFDKLDRYVELEVAGHDADAAIPGLRAHLEGSPACREEHESLYALVSASRLLTRPSKVPLRLALPPAACARGHRVRLRRLQLVAARRERR